MSSNVGALNQLQNDTNRVIYENSRKNLGSNRMDRDSFIQLIMAQVQYQDPTDPDMDMTQMLTQQLQLEQADQMKNMTDSTTFAHASGLIGTSVSMIDAAWDFNNGISDTPEWDAQSNGPKMIFGNVDAVQYDRQHGKALLLIDGKYYDSSQVRTVSPTVVVPET